MLSLFDSRDATCNTHEMDTGASQGSTKRDGVGAEEQRHRRQLRRTANRTKQDGGASVSAMAVGQGGQQGRTEEPQQDRADGHTQKASNDARPVLYGVGHSAGQSVNPRSGQHAETDADPRGEGTARGTRTHSKLWLDQVPFSKGSTRWRSDSAGWTKRTNQTSRESHAEHRVTRETAALCRSTRANRGRAQVRTTSTHTWSQSYRRSWKIS